MENNTTEAIPHELYRTIGIIMSLLFVFGLVEHVMVLYVYITDKHLHTKTNYWICAVIVCDLLLVLNAFPYVVVSSFTREHLLGSFGCKYDGFIVTVLGVTSIFLLTGLSVHRHGIMLCYPRVQSASKSLVFKSVGVCFVFGVFWGVTPLIGWGSFALEGIEISCAPNWRSKALRDVSYTIAMFICVLFIPLLLMGYCYTGILLKIWREKRMHSEWIKQRRVMRDIRVTISVAFTILSFIVSWTPYAIVSLLEAFCDIELIQISPMLVQLPCLMAKAACIWNPLVYVSHNSQFRTAFVKKFGAYKLTRTHQMTLRTSVSNGVPDNDSAVETRYVYLRKYSSKPGAGNEDVLEHSNSTKG